MLKLLDSLYLYEYNINNKDKLDKKRRGEMKTATKFLMGCLTVAASAVIFSSQSFAAEKITKVESTIKAQINADINNKNIPGWDPFWNKFESNFKINQPVKDGDFFEV